MEYFLALTVLACVLVQGGYFPTIFLLAGLVLAGGLVCAKIKKSFGICLVWALAVWYLCAALQTGYRADVCAQAFLPVSCAMFLTLYRSLPGAKRERFFSILILGGGAVAGISILAFCGVLPLNGAVTARRLQGTFQYANAAGSWFAATALLAQDSGDSRCRKLSAVNITALFLTRSTAAIGLYLLMQGIRAFSRRKDSVWIDAILLHTAALAFAVVFFLVPGWPAVPILLALFLLGWQMDRVGPICRRFHIQWFSLILAAAALVAALYSQRFASSVSTFAERLVQMKDGLEALMCHPLFGLGAGNWSVLFPYFQSAQYSAAVIHSSPIMIGVDAGIPALAISAGLVVLGLKTGRRNLPQNLALSLLLLHSMFDFTMRFFPLAVLLLALLFADEEVCADSSRTALWKGTAAVCALLCIWLLGGELSGKKLNTYVNARNWTAAQEYYEERRFLFGESREARKAYVCAAYQDGNMELVLRLTQDTEGLYPDELLQRAMALMAVGDRDGACDFLLSQIEHRLYQPGLFQKAAELFRLWKVDDATINRYNRLVEQANQRRTILGDLMGNQVYIDKMK